MTKRRIFSIIVAAGTGSRFGASLPKQFCNLEGKPVLIRTLEAMAAALPEAEQVVVISPEMASLWNDLCTKYGAMKHHIVAGGATRFNSVANALRAISKLSGEPKQGDIISVHDGARPLVTPSLVKTAIRALADTVDGVLPAIPVTDSLRRLASDSDHAKSETVDRALYRAVQTPQFFHATLLLEAYMNAFEKMESTLDEDLRNRFTDDASVMEFAHFNNIILTPGSPENIKITHPNDLAVASLLLAERRT